jgi:hypothetical protein
MKYVFVSNLMLLAACAAPAATAFKTESATSAQRGGPPPYDPGSQWDLEPQHLSGPPPKGKPPPPSPPPGIASSKRLAKIAAMSPGEIAQWLRMPWIASKAHGVSVSRFRGWPIIWLNAAPSFNPRLGVCSRSSWTISYVSSPKVQDARDPLIEPIGTAGPEVHYRAAATSSGCNADMLDGQWTAASSAEKYAAGVRIMREALATIGSDSGGLAIECLIYPPVPPAHPCPDPIGFLRKLRPEFAKAVGPTFWSDVLPEARMFNASNEAWQLSFPDPELPDVEDRVYIRGGRDASAMRVERHEVPR